jgi:hypothetical protein
MRDLILKYEASMADGMMNTGERFECNSGVVGVLKTVHKEF